MLVSRRTRDTVWKLGSGTIRDGVRLSLEVCDTQVLCDSVADAANSFDDNFFPLPGCAYWSNMMFFVRQKLTCAFGRPLIRFQGHSQCSARLSHVRYISKHEFSTSWLAWRLYSTAVCTILHCIEPPCTQ